MLIKLYNQNEREEAFDFARRVGGDLFQLQGCQLFRVIHPEGGDETSAIGDVVYAVSYTRR